MTNNNKEDDKYIRLLADFENYKKTSEKRIRNTRKTTENNVLCMILPLLDNVERALPYVDADGKKAIENMVNDTLDKLELSKVGFVGEKFDTDKHNAIGIVDRDGESGCVVEVLKCGYKFHDEILRHADVLVQQ